MIMSQVQQDWLLNNLKSSTANWKLIGNQVLYSIFNVGFAGGFTDGIPDPTNIDSIRAAENLFIDNWESYPTQRKNILDSIRLGDIDNVVFLTGDSHCSWAFDIPEKPVDYPNPATLNIPVLNPYNAAAKEGYNPVTQEGSWAVEYATPSISSPNFDEAIGAATTAQFELAMNNPLAPLEGAIYNPHCRYVDLDRHGYFILDIKADSIHADYYYVSRIDTNVAVLQTGNAHKTLLDSNQVYMALAPAPPKTIQDIPTPTMPQSTTDVKTIGSHAVLFSLYPNPADEELYVQLGLQEKTEMEVIISDISGKTIGTLVPRQIFNKGLYNLRLSLDLVKQSGTYLLQFKGKDFVEARKLQVIK
jgi:alkaline phosphatase D